MDDLKEILGKQFHNQTINIDNCFFKDCTFDSCKIIYSGNPVGLSFCLFNNCDWGFNNYALNTLAFLTSMYHMSDAGKITIEKTFENIRNKQY